MKLLQILAFLYDKYCYGQPSSLTFDQWLKQQEPVMECDKPGMKRNSANKSGEVDGFLLVIIFGVLFFMLLIPGCMWAYPQYNVYSQRLQGEAMLAHAQASKEVAVAEAKAKGEAATMLAHAEVERAKGVAEANQIIGQSLKDNESYLRYLWINGLESNNPTVIYVPTEANLPLLEATRLKQLPPQPERR